MKQTFLRQFRTWLLDEERPSSLHAIDETTAKAYRTSLAAALSPITWSPRLAGVKHFFAWAARNDVVLLDPFARVHCPPHQKQLPPYLTKDEVRAVLDACNPETQLRDRAILELLYSSALRIGELARLDLPDIDFAGRVLAVRQGKGKKDRFVPIGRIAATLVQRYVQTARVASRADARALFVDDLGHRVTEDGVRRYILAPAVRAAGVVKHITPHVLRHSCAIHMLEGGASVRHVQLLLGHAKLATTQRYLAVIPTQLKKAYALAHPSEHQQMPAAAPAARHHWRARKTKERMRVNPPADPE